MIEINDVQFVDYTMLVSGNDGEEQLVVCISPSQAFKVAIGVMRVQCDGKVAVLRAPQKDHARDMNTECTMAIVRGCLEQWAFGGIPPNPQQKFGIEQRIKGVLAQFHSNYFF